MNNYVLIYIVGLVSAIMYPPRIIPDGGAMYWNWLWDNSNTTHEPVISYSMLGTEIVVMTLIFLVLMFFGDNKNKE